MKDIGQEGFLRWRSEAVTLRQETKDPYKIAVIERFRLEEIQGKRFRPSGFRKVTSNTERLLHGGT